MNGPTNHVTTGYTVCVELVLLAFVIAVVVIDMIARREKEPATPDATTQKIIVDLRNRR